MARTLLGPRVDNPPIHQNATRNEKTAKNAKNAKKTENLFISELGVMPRDTQETSRKRLIHMQIDWPSNKERATVPAVVDELAQRSPDCPFLYDATTPETTVYALGAIQQGMSRIAAVLRENGVSSGDHVAILAPNGAFLVMSILGAQRAGAAAIVIYPPGGRRTDQEYRAELGEQLRRSGTRALLVGNEYRAADFLAEPFDIHTLAATIHEQSIAGGPVGDPGPMPADSSAVGLLQFTSGSTGRTRGVLLTHQNLLDNVHAMALGFGLGESDRMVSWLPLAHDMGLIGTVLLPLLTGFPVWLMRPQHFVLRPVSWLRAISNFRGTITFAPNFGYQRCVNTVRSADCTGLDLSSLRVAVCAAEPVVRSTLDTFYERFRSHGLRDGVLCPAYGLAENTVGATTWAVGRPAHFMLADYEALTIRNEARAPTQSAPSIAVCSVGYPFPGIGVTIVDDDARPLPEGAVGEIMLSGRTVARGYYGDSEAPNVTFRNGTLHTGDCGFMFEGQLFISGRKKDIIIHAGRNYHPQDFETAVLGIEGVLQAAAFGVFSQASGTQEIVLLVATRAPGEIERQALISTCQKAILDNLAVAVHDVKLVGPYAIPKTTSGKVRRAECARLYLSLKERSDDDGQSQATTA